MQAINSNAQVKTHTAVKIQAIHTSEHKLQSTHKINSNAWVEHCKHSLFTA